MLRGLHLRGPGEEKDKITPPDLTKVSSKEQPDHILWPAALTHLLKSNVRSVSSTVMQSSPDCRLVHHQVRTSWRDYPPPTGSAVGHCPVFFFLLLQ